MPKQFFFILIAVAGAIWFFVPGKTLAYTYSRASVMSTSAGESLTIFGEGYKGGASITVADINGDGIEERIFGAGTGMAPEVKVMDADNNTLMSWKSYPEKMTGGVNVAAGDIDGDGVIEVITAPQSVYAPLVRIFKNGVLASEFLAFPSGYHEGLSVAVISKTDKTSGMIIVGTQGLRKNEIRIYSAAGELQRRWMTPVGRNNEMGVSVAAGWSEDWHEPIIVTGAGYLAAPRVMIYGIESKKIKVSWLAFSSTMNSGVNVDYRDGIIAVAPKSLGQPIVKTFNVAGKFTKQYEFFEDTFRGGMNVKILSNGSSYTVAAVPTTSKTNQKKVGAKKIVVDLSEQKLYMYEGTRLVSTRRISSGKWSTPTPIGTYKTKNKIQIAYSKPYKLYMEWWMAFTNDGKYGLHSLPFWKTRNGRLYEGAAHIGTPVSHGCIRQTVKEAKSLYDWAPIGTPVIIRA